MTEYWDLTDDQRRPLGITHPRGRQYPLPDGTFHTVVVVLTVDTEGHLLITRRSPNKGMYPGYWEPTGGSGVAGEDSITSALRELHEETGLEASPDRLTLLGTVREPGAFADIYLHRFPGPSADAVITLQEGETDAFRWVTFYNFDLLLQHGLIPGNVAMVIGTVRDKLIEAVGEAVFYRRDEPLDELLSACPARNPGVKP